MGTVLGVILKFGKRNSQRDGKLSTSSMVEYCLLIALLIGSGTAIALMPETSVDTDYPVLPEGGEIVGPAEVIDGDTIAISGLKIRLHGIDAPERDQSCFAEDGTAYPCGISAHRALEELIASHELQCKGDTTDRYGRLLAICYKGTEDINAEMVRSGWAVAYRRYSEEYAAAEQGAKDGHHGLWQGYFQMPWNWRNAPETRTAERNTPDCNIKGNISGSGKIYHTPESLWYNRTRVNEQAGERWFCSESEALAAGWRSPRFD